ncbi:hypothetical protein EAF04_010941 [Stromatinia cepivora]|nr:hypothetical protein EAF04_010941 [Stromatinia cepivora]
MVSTIFSDQILQTSSGTITTWLPLSTAWPSTAACSSLVYVGSGKDAGKVFGWDPLYQAVLDTGSPRCFADEMASWWLEPSSVTISLGPTFNCPAAYSTVATSVHSAGVTQVFCCPTDYKLSALLPSHTFGDYPTQCMSTLTSGDILKYQTPTGGIYQPTSLTVSETLLVHGEHINGWNIDDAVFASMTGSSQTPSITSPSTATSSTSGVYATTAGGWGGALTTKTLESATASSSSSNSPSAAPPTSTKSTSTSPALAAGVGVAAAIIILCLAAALFLFIRRRKKLAITNTNMIKEIDSKEVHPRLQPFPHGQLANELSVERPPGEMDGGTNPNVALKGYYAPRQHVYEL